MIKTVDYIPYLCCVADTNEFYGAGNQMFKDWETKVKLEFAESNSENYEEWLIEKFIPFYEKYPKTDLDILYLPKVFRIHTLERLKRIRELAWQCHIKISINENKNLALVL